MNFWTPIDALTRPMSKFRVFGDIDGNRSSKPAVWFYAAALGLMTYVGSFGPACWITSQLNLSGRLVTVTYAPVIWIWQRTPDCIFDVVTSYTYFGAEKDWAWMASPVLDNSGKVSFDRHGAPRMITVWGPAP